MAANEIHKSDVGTIFRATIQDSTFTVDVSAAGTKQLKFRKPSGTVVTQTAAFTTDGTDGRIQYTTVSGDLDSTGQWSWQAYVALAAGTWHSSVSYFDVHPNLA